MRGEVLGFDGSEGLISGADGNRYRFAAAELRRPGIAPGSPVDFVAEADLARDIYPLSSFRPAGTAYPNTPAPAAGAAAAPAPAYRPAPPPPAGIPARPADAPLTPPAAPFVPLAPAPHFVDRDRGVFAYFFRAATDDYANFHGRARRKEYWGYLLFYTLFLLLILVLLGIGLGTSHFTGTASDISLSPLLFIGSGLLVLYLVALLVPSFAVAVRRLHDIGCSGWWLLLHFVPGVGSLVLLVMSLIGGQPIPNRWGPPTKAP